MKGERPWTLGRSVCLAASRGARRSARVARPELRASEDLLVPISFSSGLCLLPRPPQPDRLVSHTVSCAETHGSRVFSEGNGKASKLVIERTALDQAVLSLPVRLWAGS